MKIPQVEIYKIMKKFKIKYYCYEQGMDGAQEFPEYEILAPTKIMAAFIYRNINELGHTISFDTFIKDDYWDFALTINEVNEEAYEHETNSGNKMHVSKIGQLSITIPSIHDGIELTLYHHKKFTVRQDAITGICPHCGEDNQS